PRATWWACTSRAERSALDGEALESAAAGVRVVGTGVLQAVGEIFDGAPYRAEARPPGERGDVDGRVRRVIALQAGGEGRLAEPVVKAGEVAGRIADRHITPVDDPAHLALLDDDVLREEVGVDDAAFGVVGRRRRIEEGEGAVAR